MKTWKKITLMVIGALAACYILACFVALKNWRRTPVCKELSIEITDHSERSFVDTDELRRWLDQSEKNPVEQPLSSHLCYEVEQQALKHPMIRKASCYATTDGKVMLKVTQRVPILRVSGNTDYFVDEDRRVMEVRSTTASDVPVVTGSVSTKMATGEMYDFVKWMNNTPYWDAQIVQIHVTDSLGVLLTPRVGEGVIVLGSLRGYKQKLGNLEKLYKDGFSKIGWKNYKEIDVRYKGQVVCR